jgi:hypothetical protein
MSEVCSLFIEGKILEDAKPISDQFEVFLHSGVYCGYSSSNQFSI